ncbi:uncharacterized protein LOC119791076 [Cyprinodon tularosa]|uniref:uncharacterized protein LOC119791076 n=1 Tax=Cyprinodon tularosa TaxID=77115 RepID=UPI0018E288C3|nr:uncharacterized protein LOC119791076 [Cyprinodon tularosa]
MSYWEEAELACCRLGVPLEEVSLVALLLLDVHGLPVKAPKSQQQGGSGTNAASQGVAAPSHAAHASFSAPVGKVPSHPFPVQQPAPFVGMSPMAGVYLGSFPVQPGQYGAYAIPAAYSSDGSQLAGYYAASQPADAAQPIPTAEWVVAPPSFEEPAADSEVVGALLPPPQPLGPTLQSGETANIVKEAELGHYQRETEESGYPAVPTNPGFGGLLPYPLVPLYGLPYPYPAFDYRLLFGQYPPGTYTTFSRNHERGRDYSKEIHYLKEHVSDAPQTPQNPGLGQQKFFPRSP